MQILITNSFEQTVLFGGIFIAIFIYFFRKKENYTSFSLTQELKGLAILTIVFGHIGYFLSTDTSFLFPFSVLAGVGVNLFLFLSGYGLTFSQMQKDESVLGFYKKRLLKLYKPFWIVLVTLLITNYLFLSKTYSNGFIIQSFLGIFTSADVFSDINSPFWYLTLIILYYLLFPIFFFKKQPWITAIILCFIVWGIVELDPERLSGVIGLYEVHFLTFPLGVIVAWIVSLKTNILSSISQVYKKNISWAHPSLTILLLAIISYFSIYFSGVGEKALVEQSLSLFVMGAILLLFLIKKRESKLFSIFGLYSYEIYLFHWPLVYQFDFLYKNISAGFATIIYLVIFLLLAMLLKKCGKINLMLS